MNILIINCHWNNRGDEAAIRAMLDELHNHYPNAMLYVQKANGTFRDFPESEHVKALPSSFPAHTKRRRLLDQVAYLTNGRICITQQQKVFFKVLRKADLVIHAPGGPSIGDLYLSQEEMKLKRLDIIRRNHIPYIFYAPSMGPFQNEKRNPIRKRVLENAVFICLRESKSADMLTNFLPSLKPIVTLDSAFQHPIDENDNEQKYRAYPELKEFIGDGKDVIGLTVTDLQWHAAYRDDHITAVKIRDVFTSFIKMRIHEGYKILFIPQLFGDAKDREYMRSFATENCFVMDDTHDCYFQQYVISRLKAVVGMRYHSNIFSAKMGTPFISISYEQKMEGFMRWAGLMDNCIQIQDLTFDLLETVFDRMLGSYDQLRTLLAEKKEIFRSQSAVTTELVCKYIDEHVVEPNKIESPINLTPSKGIETTIKLFFKSVKSDWRIRREYVLDRKAYQKWQYMRPGMKARSALEGKILRQTHTIEKGMSLESPRERFGVQKTMELLDYIDEYEAAGYRIEDSMAVRNSIGVIGAYLDFHYQRGFEPEEIVKRYQKIAKFAPAVDKPFGIDHISLEQLNNDIHGEFPAFISSRHSVRQFARQRVSILDIRKSVELAMYAPSACNRQSCHIYYYESPEMNATLGKLITGNTGFENAPSNYLVITSDLSCYHDAFERNQVYVDGGIMTMALIEALHYYGIASCVLQNGEYADKNIAFKKACGNIPESERIVCFIAIGYYKDHFAYATSHRKELSDVLIEK